MLSLKPRLALCAELVRPAKALADVGTDHAYLPIWLLISGKTPRALACDINRGPLESARRSARLYGVEDRLKLVQSDGLKQVSREDAEDVVIAGMGGELILRIAGETPWLRDPRRRLILQPMTRADKLRAGLWDLGFRILRERAAEDGGRFYSAFSAEYAGDLPPCSRLYPYMGELRPGEPAVAEYAEKTARELGNRLRGAEHEGDQKSAEELRRVLQELLEAYRG